MIMNKSSVIFLSFPQSLVEQRNVRMQEMTEQRNEQMKQMLEQREIQ